MRQLVEQLDIVDRRLKNSVVMHLSKTWLEIFYPCTAGRFWKDSRMAEVMADNARQSAPTFFHAHESDRLSLIRISQHRLGSIHC